MNHCNVCSSTVFRKFYLAVEAKRDNPQDGLASTILAYNREVPSSNPELRTGYPG
jgi:hypothetical protein